MTVKLYPNEIVIKAGDTVQSIGSNRIAGKLIVTNQRVYFKAVDESNDSYNLEIEPSSIEEVIFTGRGLFAPKGLDVVTVDGRTHSFPLKKRDEIGRVINSMY